MKPFLISTLFFSSLFVTQVFPQDTTSVDKGKIFLMSPQEYDLEDLNENNQGDSRKPNLSQLDTQQLSYTIKGILSSIYVNNDYIIKTPQLKTDLDNLTNTNLYQNKKDFMLASVKFFQELNDLHTGLNFGYPYNCFLSGFPLKTKRIYNATSQKYNYIISEKGNLNSLIEAIKKNEFVDEQSAAYYSGFDFEKIKENFDKIQVGDVLVSMTNPGLKSNDPNLQDQPEGMPQAFDFNADISDSRSPYQILSPFSRTHKSNYGATLARTSDLIFSRFGGAMQIPGSSNIKNSFVLTTQKDSYEFPWFTVLSSDMLNDSNNMCLNMVDKNYRTEKDLPKVYLQGGHSSYPTETFFDAIPSLKKIDDSTVSEHLISHNKKQYAYIQIKEFLPGRIIDPDYKNARKQILDSIASVKNFIAQNKDKIQGVIFDIRDNPGGYGSYAAGLGKLFKTKSPYEDFLLYPIASQANKEMYQNLKEKIPQIIPNLSSGDGKIIDNIFTDISKDFTLEKEFTLNSLSLNNKLEVLDKNFDSDPNDSLQVILDSIYGVPSLGLSPNSELTQYQSLFQKQDRFYDGDAKHVAVLINGNSFSSSDIFTSLFKNYEIAKIYGEDTQASGGGGANVIFYNQFQTQEGQTNIIPKFNANGLVSGVTAPPMPNDMLLSFAWNRVIGMKCLSHSDCLNPESPDDFVEKYYFEPLDKRDINGVPVDVVLNKSKEDVLEPLIENQPIFIKIMDDLN